MKSIARWMLLTAMTLTNLASDAAGPTGLNAGDAHAVRAVVEAQLDAIAADDEVGAFSYASPSIRNQFDDASSFMTMVRQGYPMLIRPVEMLFSQPRAIDEDVFQVVRLRDQDGRPWLATYQLQRQPDKSWRINGCMVEPDESDDTLT